MLLLERNTSGTAGNGIGGYIEFQNETNSTPSTLSGQIHSSWAIANHATRTSQFTFYGVGAATTQTLLLLHGDRRIVPTARFEYGYSGTAAANDLTLDYLGNVFSISGTTQINAITTTGWQSGSEITLIFEASVTVKDNTTGGAGTAPIQLAGSLDFGATLNDVLKLVYNGTNWLEVSRSAN